MLIKNIMNTNNKTRRMMGMMTILLFIGTFFFHQTTYADDAQLLVTKINEWAHGGTGELIAKVNEADDSEVIVTGDITGATATSLALNIDLGVVVNWQADLNGTAPISLAGNGEFLMTDGTIDYLGALFAIASNGNNTITVNDGEITGGIMAYGANNIVAVNGGTVIGATTAHAINASGANGKVFVSGGTVTNTGVMYVISMGNTNTGLNVVVSGEGKVIQAGSGQAIVTYGSVEVKDDAEVSSINGYAINALGASGSVTISGGKVTSTLANAVIYIENTQNTGLNVEVSGSGKVIHTGVGVGNGISTNGSVEVKDEAVVTASNFAIRILRSGTATISGGTVTSTTSNGTGIYAEGPDSKVIVTGGTVTATNSRAIYAEGANSKVIVTGGEVTGGIAGISLVHINAVAYISGGTVSYVYTFGANSIDIRKSGSDDQYIEGEDQDLTASPEGASAIWAVEAGKSGVRYKRNSNEGFLETPGITVLEAKYTVTFDYNDEDTEPLEKEVKAGEPVEEPAKPTRNGYAFKGWFEASATIAFDFNTPITENITLIAKWNPTYIVIFKFDNGTTVDRHTEVEEGEKVTRPTPNPTREGYTFDGWFEASATNAFDFNMSITRNITLIAKWTEVPPTGNGEIFAPNFKIFPNPFTDILRIEGAEGSILQVINGNGVIVHLQKIENDNETLRLQHLQQGVYFFRIEKDQKMITLKVVKM